MYNKTITGFKADFRNGTIVTGKTISVNFPILKDMEYFDTAYGYYNFRVISDTIKERTQKDNKIVANENDRYSVKRIEEASNDLEMIDKLNKEIEEKFSSYVHPANVEEIRNDKIAQLVAVTCGYVSTPVDVSEIHAILKTTENHASLDSDNRKKLVNELQLVMDGFSLESENKHYTAFKFRANKTMVNKIFRVYYDGNKNQNGHLIDHFEDAKQLKKWVLEEMVKRLEAVTVKNANVEIEEIEKQD